MCLTGAGLSSIDGMTSVELSAKLPKRSVWPLSASFCNLLAKARTFSRLKRRSERSPSASKPPDLISDSQTRLLHLLVETRLAKSSTVANFPSRSRILTISSTAPTPTPFTAAIPKRICFLPGTTANSSYDSLTSGLRTVRPICLHSVISIASRSTSSWSLVIKAAIKASG